MLRFPYRCGLGGKHKRAGFILWAVQDAVKAKRLVVSGSVVNKVKDNETLFPRSIAGAPADLLKVNDFRERGAGHQKDFIRCRHRLRGHKEKFR